MFKTVSIPINVKLDVSQVLRMFMEIEDIRIPEDFDRKFEIKFNEEWDSNAVYHKGTDEVYDSRGDLYISLLNLITNVIPNYENRSSRYIWNDVDYTKVDLEKMKVWCEDKEVVSNDCE